MSNSTYGTHRRDAGKKTQPVEDCAKSTPKEEGGGDIVWIDRLESDPTETDYPESNPSQQAFFCAMQ
jgi:hypothetical protein